MLRNVEGRNGTADASLGGKREGAGDFSAELWGRSGASDNILRHDLTLARVFAVAAAITREASGGP